MSKSILVIDTPEIAMTARSELNIVEILNTMGCVN